MTETTNIIIVTQIKTTCVTENPSSHLAVKRDIKKETATEKEPIKKFNHMEASVPFSKINNSDSVTS
jgi:hypothetical protein